MSINLHSLIASTIITAAISSVYCFNIETRYPIIIQNLGAAGGKNKAPNYFGASVSFLKADQGSSWILIGAPKANSTAHNDVIEPGVIWQCSLGQATERCRPVIMDPTGNSFEDSENNVRDWKNGGWLGGSGLALNEKNFVACANRWEDRWTDGETTWMHGICYKRPRSDLFKESLPPTPPSTSNYRLIPLAGLTGVGNKKFWRYGQAGFSVHFPKTGNEIVMGAPGTERWSGSVIQYLSMDGGDTFRKSYMSKPLTYQNYVTAANYLGYSISSGYFFEMRGSSISGGDINSTNKRALIQYVAGAPRGGSNLAGKVILFRFPDNDNDPLRIMDEYMGDQAGSYFGASLLALDVNGDGFDDLLVGAPRYSRNQKLKDSARIISRASFEKFGGYGDEGAVFLYLSNGIALSRQQKILHGDNRAWAQFGTAMASLGDLNRDGFNDFVVSAPFEGGSGSVYIYHGTRTGLITTHAQVIRAGEVDTKLTGFGFSLAASEDIDNNGYNDLAIGSFNSSQTVVLRSKPIITVHGEMKSSMKKLPIDIESFLVESCVSYTGDVVPPSIQLGVKLRADAAFRPQRVKLRPAESEGSQAEYSISYIVTVTQAGVSCRKFAAVVIEPLESSGAPVIFRQDIYIPDDSEFQVKPRIMNIHVDGSYSVSGEPFSGFCKTCPVINKAKPMRFELQLPLAVMCGEDDICEVDLQLQVSFRDINTDQGYLIGSTSSIIMDVEMLNLKETAIAPAVTISWWRLKLKQIPSDCSLLSEDGHLITYKCNLGKLLKENERANVSLEFDVSNLIVQETTPENELVFNITAVTASEMIHPESKNIILLLYAMADMHVEGSRYLEPFNPNTISPFVVFKHIFEVGLEGPSSVANIWAVFQLPVNLTTMSEPVVNVRGVNSNGQMTCQPTKGHFARSDLTPLFNEDASAETEDNPDFDVAGIGGYIPADKDLSRDSNSSLVENDRLLIHCDSPFVACMEVTCKTALFTPTQTATISFVMDIKSDMIRSLMKTHQVSAIQVESKGTLILPQVVKDFQPKPNRPDETVSITIVEKEGYKRVSKWIYTIAIVLGLLVLACVVFCLYACGCFEKNSPPTNDNVDGDAVDGADEEEMVPLQQKPTGTEEEDGDIRSGREEDDVGVSPQYGGRIDDMSPSTHSTMTEPPEFIPRQPPIPEQPEDEEEDEETDDLDNF